MKLNRLTALVLALAMALSLVTVAQADERRTGGTARDAR